MTPYQYMHPDDVAITAHFHPQINKQTNKQTHAHNTQHTHTYPHPQLCSAAGSVGRRLVGVPEDVAASMTPYQYMRPGDVAITAHLHTHTRTHPLYFLSHGDIMDTSIED